MTVPPEKPLPPEFNKTVPVAFTGVRFAVPLPVPGSRPTVLPFALEAGMPIINRPVPLMKPFTVIVFPAEAASVPPAPLKNIPRLGAAPALSKVNVALPKSVPPFIFTTAPVAIAPRPEFALMTV